MRGWKASRLETRHFTQSDDNLQFSSTDATFNCRVVAVIRRGKHVLLHRAISDDHWALPGGRPHHFESAAAALRREMREEIGEAVEVGELRAVIEAVYAIVHEINICFDAFLPADTRLGDVTVEHRGDEEDVPLIYRWFREDELHDLYLLPRPVAAMLTAPRDRCDYWFDDERLDEPGEWMGQMAENQRLATAEASRGAGIAYHLTPVEVWERQRGRTSYVPEAFEQDGFIHTTNGLDPLLEVANLFYTGDPRTYRVLVLSMPAIAPEVRYDDDHQIYPHIYGPLNTSAVVGELVVRRAADGAFVGFE